MQFFISIIGSCECHLSTLTDDGSGKWPYGGAIEAAKSMGAKVEEKVRRLLVIFKALMSLQSFMPENRVKLNPHIKLI